MVPYVSLFSERVDYLSETWNVTNFGSCEAIMWQQSYSVSKFTIYITKIKRNYCLHKKEGYLTSVCISEFRTQIRSVCEREILIIS
jgi:hypothetical protein